MLSLRELETSASLAATELLTFHHTTITREKTGFSQQVVQFRIPGFQGTGDAKDDCSGLAGGSTAIDADPDIDVGSRVGCVQRCLHHLLVAFDPEEFFQGSTIDHKLAVALFDSHAGH